MTLGSCALCLDGYKSQLYGGPCRGRRDLWAPTFPFPHPDHRGIFRGRDDSGGGGKEAVLSMSGMKYWENWASNRVLADKDWVEAGTWCKYR